MPARRVMIVDDNRDAAEMLGSLLEALGASVQVVYSGRAALDMLDSFDPDAVLLDIGMPEMDGYEVARRLRLQPRWQGLVIVALTGWGQEEDRQRTRAAGFDYHLVKPTDLDGLQRLLADIAARAGATVGMAAPDVPRTH
jgi:CheY-like chemotaxis protein